MYIALLYFTVIWRTVVRWLHTICEHTPSIWLYVMFITIYNSRCLGRARSIIKDYTHPGYHLFNLLPSGRRYRAIPAKTNRLRDSFFPRAVTILNSNLHWGTDLLEHNTVTLHYVLSQPTWQAQLCVLSLFIIIYLFNIITVIICTIMLLLSALYLFYCYLLIINCTIISRQSICFFCCLLHI